MDWHNFSKNVTNLLNITPYLLTIFKILLKICDVVLMLWIRIIAWLHLMQYCSILMNKIYIWIKICELVYTFFGTEILVLISIFYFSPAKMKFFDRFKAYLVRVISKVPWLHLMFIKPQIDEKVRVILKVPWLKVIK